MTHERTYVDEPMLLNPKLKGKCTGVRADFQVIDFRINVRCRILSNMMVELVVHPNPSRETLAGTLFTNLNELPTRSRFRANRRLVSSGVFSFIHLNFACS